MKKILLVEDEADTSRMYQELLVQEGYDVLVSPDGEHALQVIGDYAPDLILMDIMLPGIDGIEVVRRLSEREDTRHTPIIVITALDGFTLGQGFFGQGMSELSGVCRFVYKPCRPKTLLESIADVLQYSRGTS